MEVSRDGKFEHGFADETGNGGSRLENRCRELFRIAGGVPINSSVK
jgi:hypothetical protein